MQTALHQDPSAAERYRLIDLFADLLKAANVSVGCTRATVERAESANDVADVGVVDVAIDDVGDDVIGVTPRADLISSGSRARDVVRFEQRSAFLDAQALSRKHAIKNRLNVGGRHIRIIRG